MLVLFIDLVSGYNTSIRWESTASLTVNDSFDDASESVTCSTPTSAISTPNRVSAISDTLSNSRQRASSPVVKSNNETSSGPPPLPRKQSQVDTTDSTYMSPHSVRMRKHSHKGLVSLLRIQLFNGNELQCSSSLGLINCLW